jgi:hypothetical protein
MRIALKRLRTYRQFLLQRSRHRTSKTAIWNNDGGKAMMLNMGNATLELFDERQAEVIDDFEAGKRNPSVHCRSASPFKCQTCTLPWQLSSPTARGLISSKPARYDSAIVERPPARSRRDAPVTLFQVMEK